MVQPYYTNTNRDIQNNIPAISHNLDSVRTYQFEIHFKTPEDVEGAFTLAAKAVTNAGFTTEDIEVHRLNDRVYYPGKASTEEITVTFDNLYQPQIAAKLYNWFSRTYNAGTGTIGLAADIKGTAVILQLDNKGNPIGGTKLIGIYPKTWKTAEFNYATNEFHTIEVGFRYDFVVQLDQGLASA
jgi:hypothetical protein